MEKLSKYGKIDIMHLSNIIIEILANEKNARDLIELHKHTQFTDKESNTVFEEALSNISNKLKIAREDYYGTLHNKRFGDYSVMFGNKKIYFDLKNAEDSTSPDYCGCIGRDSLEEPEDILYVCLNNTLNKIYIVSRYDLYNSLLSGEHNIKFKKAKDGSEYLGYKDYSKLCKDKSYEYILDRR